MTDIYALAALWLGLALAATLLSIWLRIATAIGDRRRDRCVFGPLQARAAKSGVKANFVVVVGHPAEQIDDETHAVDHIVIGHRGKSFFARWLLGSVSKQVMHYAHCTTTAVR